MNFITERYERAVLSQSDCKSRRVELEIEEFGISYAHLGALLLNLWRLPDAVTLAVKNQHSKNKEDFVDAPVSVSLMLADFLVEDTDAEDHLEDALSLLPDLEVDAWRERLDEIIAVSQPN